MAKSLVIWQMLCDVSLHPCTILQVWFSLGWTAPTLGAFRKALDEVRGSTQQAVADNRVKKILDHWSVSGGVNLSTARQRLAKKKLKMMGTDNSFIGYLKRKKDRRAMAIYELTGDFCLDAVPTSGNVTVFDCPKGTPPPSLEENVFSSLDFNHVMTVCEHLPDNADVLKCAAFIYITRVTRLAKWAAAGSITVTLHCQKVDDDVADNIRRLSPRTMSWSNVLDYMYYPDFHFLARNCSLGSGSTGHGTTHYGYSMKWGRHVFGTSLIDMEFSRDKLASVVTIQKANKAISQWYQQVGWDKYLRLPIPDNPVNTVSKLLSELHRSKWIDHFFSNAHCQTCTHVPSALVTLAEQGFQNIQLKWSYV